MKKKLLILGDPFLVPQDQLLIANKGRIFLGFMAKRLLDTSRMLK
jgi:hypothetical protein